MKTLIIYNDIISPVRFLIVEGDYSRFNGVIVNSLDGNGFEQEFCDWMFNSETGDFNHELSEDINLVKNKDWDEVAICNFLP